MISDIVQLSDLSFLVILIINLNSLEEILVDDILQMDIEIDLGYKKTLGDFIHKIEEQTSSPIIPERWK